jgi:hypothetical protein
VAQEPVKLNPTCDESVLKGNATFVDPTTATCGPIDGAVLPPPLLLPPLLLPLPLPLLLPPPLLPPLVPPGGDVVFVLTVTPLVVEEVELVPTPMQAGQMTDEIDTDNPDVSTAPAEIISI